MESRHGRDESVWGERWELRERQLQLHGAAAALTTPTGFLTLSFNNGLVGSGATISINSMMWNVYNVGFNAETLLHEMGHLFNFSRGSGGFAPPNVAELRNSQAFDQLIHKDCGL